MDSLLYNHKGEALPNDGGVSPNSSSSPSSPNSSAAVHTEPKSDTPISPDAVPLTIAENAKQAGCYTFVTEVWSVDEAHPEMTRAIREQADPRYVPLLCKRVYRTPADTEITRTYYCIGRHIPFPTDEYRDAAIRLSYVPRGFPFPPSEIQCLRTLWAPWDTKDEEGRPHHPVEYNNNTPPEEVPVGPWLLEQMAALRKFFDTPIEIRDDQVIQLETQAEKLRAILEAQTNADNDRVQRAREEARYRMRHNWPQMKDAIDNERWSPAPEEPPLFLDLAKKG